VVYLPRSNNLRRDLLDRQYVSYLDEPDMKRAAGGIAILSPLSLRMPLLTSSTSIAQRSGG
jgi:hypothetical protein